MNEIEKILRKKVTIKDGDELYKGKSVEDLAIQAKAEELTNLIAKKEREAQEKVLFWLYDKEYLSEKAKEQYLSSQEEE